MTRRGRDDQQSREPRGWQVDEIVEPRSRPAESLVARRAMADHAVGGVDRLVDGGAGKPCEQHPEDGRNDAIGKIFRQAFDRCPCNARLVERPVSRPTICDTASRAASRPPLSSASATRATCSCRLRCAINVLAANATPIRPNGSSRRPRSMTNAAMATIGRARQERDNARARDVVQVQRSRGCSPARTHRSGGRSRSTG